MYSIFVSKFTQDKLKEEQDTVKLPIDKSAVMKAHLAEWISESVIMMNEKEREYCALLGNDWNPRNLECRCQ